MPGDMRRIACSTVWGGIQDEDVDVCSRTLTASLHSASADGGRGGDIYYLSVCGDDVLTRVALADVAGHGRAVADVSEWLYRALEEHSSSLDGARILADLNELAARHGIKALTTVALAGFYRSTSSLDFSYAGHHAMLVRRRDAARGGAGWKPLDLADAGDAPANLPLGVVPGARYDQKRVELTSGDRVFLYTDGLVEAPGADSERFGLERLCTILDAHATAPLADLKSAVLEEVRRFSTRRLGHDDTTLIAIEVH